MSIDLFEPFRIGKLELRNRFVRSATNDSTGDSSGTVTNGSPPLYRELGQGEIGLIITGHAFVSPLGKRGEGQYGVHTDNMIPGLRRLVQAAHQGGAKIALQVNHAGINSRYLSRKSSAPLAVSRLHRINRPHQEMTDEDIETIISDFTSAALRAKKAGFDAVQFHGAHDFLMSQFLSPLFNCRTDRWGGNAENRRRFHLEVIKKVRRAVGADFPLMIKLGVGDNRKGGLSLSESLETARQIIKAGIDAIEVSSGAMAEAMQTMREGEPERAFFRERAAAVKRVVTVPVILIGGIRSFEMAKSIVDNGDADLISMCRPFIREPNLVARWRRGEKWPTKCISCNKCLGIVRRGKPLECGEEQRLRERACAST